MLIFTGALYSPRSALAFTSCITLSIPLPVPSADSFSPYLGQIFMVASPCSLPTTAYLHGGRVPVCGGRAIQAGAIGAGTSRAPHDQQLSSLQWHHKMPSPLAPSIPIPSTCPPPSTCPW